MNPQEALQHARDAIYNHILRSWIDELILPDGSIRLDNPFTKSASTMRDPKPILLSDGSTPYAISGILTDLNNQHKWLLFTSVRIFPITDTVTVYVAEGKADRTWEQYCIMFAVEKKEDRIFRIRTLQAFDHRPLDGMVDCSVDTWTAKEVP